MELNFYTLCVLYLVYSFLGWVAETVVATIKGRAFVNRGVASGPFCFVYGTAAVLMAVGFADLRSTPVALFLGCAANATVVEWVTAKLLERMHRRRWWDYSDKKFNLDGYVCLQYSVLWGLLGMASVLWGNVLLLRLCALLPGWLLHIGVWAAMTLAVLDQLGAALAVNRYAASHPRLEQLNLELEKHSDKLSTEGNQEEARKLLREFIFQYVVSRSYRMEGMTTEELCDSLYEDMAGISFLKKWIYKPGIEEVNINAFDDIEVIMSGGRSMKIPDRFQSPQHAIDVTRRLLNTCGMVIDDTMPSVIGFLDKNIRISVDKTPIVDADVGINASIRIVNQQTVSKEKLIASGSATEEMLELLTCCIRYGVSVCIAGSTGSGKTTVMSWLLSMVPDNRRLITIEEGSREFDLIRRDEQGHALNSVVHLLTRPHENPSLDIDQDLLLERVLRKHPDVIGVGEMRSAKEALSVAESSRTGHTVVTTIHSNSSESTYRRMMTLAKRKYNMADDILMQIMVEAYPIVVFTKQLEDGSRKIMQIIEGEDYRNGKLIYRPLYQFDVMDNQMQEDGKISVIGKHRRLGAISETLKKRMLDNGIPAGKLEPFLAEKTQPRKEGGKQHAMDSVGHIPAAGQRAADLI